MKLRNTAKLSFKNLFNNFQHSISTLFIIVLLSTVILMLSNFCFYWQKNINKNLLYELNNVGENIFLQKKQSSVAIEYLSENNIIDFISQAKKKNFSIDDYAISGNSIITFPPPVLTDSQTLPDDYFYVSFAPLLIEANETAFEKYPLLEGERWNKENYQKNYIWLSKDDSIKSGKTVGDSIQLGVELHTFIVKGIIDAHYTLIDYTWFSVKSVSFMQFPIKYDNLSFVKNVEKIGKDIKKTDKNLLYLSSITSSKDFYQTYTLIITGLSALLIMLCIALSMGCVLNTLSISIEANGNSIGIMKALGMRDKNIKQYILIQSYTIILIGTLISSVLSAILSFLTLKVQITSVFSIMSTYSENVVIGFNPLFIFLNISILILSVWLCTKKMLKTYFENSPIKIIQEAN